MRDGRPDWIKKIRVGDVVRFPSGALRTVVAVSHYQTTRGTWTTYVNFPIKRCSWTKRGVTGYAWYEMIALGGRPTRAHVDIAKYPVARKLLAEIASPTSCHMCCETVGVFE